MTARLLVCCGGLATHSPTTAEHADWCPQRYRYRTRLGDTRSVKVPCGSCKRPTLAINGDCDRCHEAKAVAA